MRLIDVFVDICFLSLRVELEDFSNSAWRRRTHSSDMSELFLSVEVLETEGLDLPRNAMRRDAEPPLRQGAYVEGLGRG